MTRVAFIGLGTMGLPMAINLAQKDFAVIGFNRTASKTEALVRAGGQAASSVAEAVADADVIATMLPDTPDVLSVLAGVDGALSLAKEGALVIDFSTISPDGARQLESIGAMHGVEVLDAPVSGGEQGAKSAALSIMVGGSAKAYARATPVFNTVGQSARLMGPAGAGQLTKAANQLLVAGTIGLLAEAIVFLENNGVEAARALEALGAGLASSTVLARKSATMTARDFRPSFRLALHDKDLRIFSDAAARSQTPVPLGAIVAQLMSSANAQGLGELDHSALLLVLDRLAGH